MKKHLLNRVKSVCHEAYEKKNEFVEKQIEKDIRHFNFVKNDAYLELIEKLI